MIFLDISNELFEYRIHLIRYNKLYNISRLIKTHDNLLLDLRDNYSQEYLDKIIIILKDYRNEIKQIDLSKYNKLINKHTKLINRLVKIENKYF